MRRELRHRENAGSEMIVYGRLPLMHSAQCVRKNTFGCNGQEERLVLKDRYDKEISCSLLLSSVENGKYKGGRVVL